MKNSIRLAKAVEAAAYKVGFMHLSPIITMSIAIALLKELIKIEEELENHNLNFVKILEEHLNEQ